MLNIKNTVMALGLTGFISFTGTAVADSAFNVSDFVVIKDKSSEQFYYDYEEPIKMGEWEYHSSWKTLYFELPEDFNPKYDAVLQLNVSSTNKSQYNAIYFNPKGFSSESFQGCDDIQNDFYENYRFDYLPYADHDHWRFYHKTFPAFDLHPGENVMLICARNHNGEVWGDLDNFYLKDIVLHYRKHVYINTDN